MFNLEFVSPNDPYLLPLLFICLNSRMQTSCTGLAVIQGSYSTALNNNPSIGLTSPTPTLPVGRGINKNCPVQQYGRPGLNLTESAGKRQPLF